MNALVEIYLDNNLGDDIMGESLVRFLENRGVNCFLIVNDEFTYSQISKKFPTVNILQNLSRQSLRENRIRFYLRIGGSIFPHNSIKEGILRYRTLFQYWLYTLEGIKIYILGCNVGPFASSVGIFASRRIFKMADLVTCRDKESYQFIAQTRNKNYYMFADTVFTRTDLYLGGQTAHVLGISTYTGYTQSLRKHNLSYCKKIVEVIDKYLEDKPAGIVKLFVFNTGYTSDYPTTHKIYNSVKEKAKVEIIAYNGDVNEFMEEFNRCSVMIGTRFHSIVLALLCRIPVLPIVYSNKTMNLLSDLGYTGPKLFFSECDENEADFLVESITNHNGLFMLTSSNILENSQGHFKVLANQLTKDFDL